RLRSTADRLVVGVSTDEFNATKGKRAIIPFEHRIEIVRSVRYVDEAFPEQSWDQKRDDIRKFSATVFAIGDDWKGKFDDLKDLCEVTYLPRTEGISSTEIREALSPLSNGKINELKSALDSVISIVHALGR